ncbi:hypothetical protein FD754_000981, partial [Muntiacus muntjak]
VSVTDRLCVKEAAELEASLPYTCKVHFSDPSKLHLPPKVNCLKQGTDWAPRRTLKDVVWGLNSLFTDALNFGDPLDIEAAVHYLGDKEIFRNKGEDYTKRYTGGYGERTAGPWNVP